MLIFKFPLHNFKLKIYYGEKHPHEIQNPVKINFSELNKLLEKYDVTNFGTRGAARLRGVFELLTFECSGFWNFWTFDFFGFLYFIVCKIPSKGRIRIFQFSASS